MIIIGVKKSHEKFVTDLQKVNPNIRVIGRYTKSKDPILCECLLCGHKWSSKANNLLTGYGCPECGISKRANSQRKTTESFIAEMMHIDSSIEIIGEYQGAQKPVKCRCAKCGLIWDPLPTNLLAKKGCHFCSKKEAGKRRMRTHDEFISALEAINPNLIVHEKYHGNSQKLQCSCKICGFSWLARPSSILKGVGCPRCAGNERYTQEAFVSKLQEINPYIKVLGEYKKAGYPIKCKCLICNHEWSPTPNRLLRRGGCPKCCHTTTSFFEQILYEVLVMALGEDKVLFHDHIAIEKELDIYIPSMKLAIEPGSWRWHKDKLVNDTMKRETCSKKGIRLVTIYTDYNEEVPPFKNDCLVSSKTFGLEQDYDALKCIVRELLELCNIFVSITEYQWNGLVDTAYLNSRRKTTIAFIEEMDAILPDVIILSEYTGALNNIQCKCRKCGNVWTTQPHNLLSGHGCKPCAASKRGKQSRKKPEVYEAELKAIHPEIILLTPYINSKEKISCKCSLCGHEWSGLPASLKKGKGCPRCKQGCKMQDNP